MKWGGWHKVGWALQSGVEVGSGSECKVRWPAQSEVGGTKWGGLCEVEWRWAVAVSAK